MFDIKESFEWMAPEFKVVDAGKNTVRIKGIAMRSNVVSKNNRKYVDEELKKAARTWIGKPVTINHNMNQKVGNVVWMEYNRGALEYLADIKKNPYVTLLRDGSATLRGVSIEANYLHNRCPQCGEQFWSEESFHKHMRDEHYMLTDATKEVHGLIGTALSLVLSPEEPGYSDTSIELMEKYEKPVLQLLETVTNYQKGKEDYMKKLEKSKVAVSSVPRITAKPNIAKEDEDIKPGSHYCEEHPDDPRCKEHKAAIHGSEQDETPSPPCPEGWHEEDGKCVKDEPEVAEQDLTVPTVDTPPPPPTGIAPLEPIKCEPGFHAEGDVCVPDEEQPLPPEVTPAMAAVPETPIPTPTDIAMPEMPGRTPQIPHVAKPPVEEPVIPTVEIALPPRLRLGEPFAGYSSFDDCVAKNPDKEDPEAYCASIKQKAEGETAEVRESKDIYEMFRNANQHIEKSRVKAMKRDVKTAEAVNLLTKAVAEIAKSTPQRDNRIIEAVNRTNQYIQQVGKTVEASNSQNAKCVKALGEYTQKKLGQLATGLAKTKQTYDAQLKQAHTNLVTEHSMNKQLRESVNKIVGDLSSVKETYTKWLAQYGKVLELSDKVVGQYKEELTAKENKIETLETELDTAKASLKTQQEEDKKLKETFDTRLENLQERFDKIANFKAKKPGIQGESSGEHTPDDPLKRKKE